MVIIFELLILLFEWKEIKLIYYLRLLDNLKVICF